MGELCSTEGGWTRLAYLDMTDSTVDCPPGLKIYENGGVRACGIDPVTMHPAVNQSSFLPMVSVTLRCVVE